MRVSVFSLSGDTENDRKRAESLPDAERHAVLAWLNDLDDMLKRRGYATTAGDAHFYVTEDDK